MVPTDDAGPPSEEYDLASGRRRGDFRQGISHIAPVSTALALFGDEEAG